jgi:hypothetical protein
MAIKIIPSLSVILFSCIDLSSASGQTLALKETFSISGSVLSTDGPIPYANIYLLNTRFGTVSNEAGEFILKFRSTLNEKDAQINDDGVRAQPGL